MARSDSTNLPNTSAKKTTDKATNKATNVCSNCGGALEPVANRLFLMYRRARLPQPKPDAWVCVHCGWVEGDEQFQALLEERINHR